MEWCETLSEELRKLLGQWVVLEGKRIVSHGPDAVQVFQDARAREIKVPYVFFVDDSPEDVICMGYKPTLTVNHTLRAALYN